MFLFGQKLGRYKIIQETLMDIQMSDTGICIS